MCNKALITGAAGFVGSHLVGELLEKGWTVTGVDNFDPFYAMSTKLSNIAPYRSNPNFEIVETDILNSKEMRKRLSGSYDVIVHLAAKAGVRPSIEDPLGYQQTNVVGTQSLLELAKEWKTKQFIFASSSSVYGINPNLPWTEEDYHLRPISPYASSKIGGELLGHVYAHLYGLRFVALRLFTVYGPRQRPDLAIHKFASLIESGNPIEIFGDGGTSRDYTYVSDITAGIISAMSYDRSQFEIFNLGNGRPVKLMDLVQQIGGALGMEPQIRFMPIQPGDMDVTFALITKAQRELDYNPNTPISLGLKRFAEWFKLPENGKRRNSSLIS